MIIMIIISFITFLTKTPPLLWSYTICVDSTTYSYMMYMEDDKYDKTDNYHPLSRDNSTCSSGSTATSNTHGKCY